MTSENKPHPITRSRSQYSNKNEDIKTQFFLLFLFFFYIALFRMHAPNEGEPSVKKNARKEHCKKNK